MTQPQGALLVGSVNYDDAETTMRTAAELLGDRLRRIPDGEVGKRFHWILWQGDVLGQADGIERVGEEPIPYPNGLDARRLRIGEGVDVTAIDVPPLGYAAAARDSYKVFRRLRAEGVIAEGVRFQVALPTPLGVIASFFTGADRAAIEPRYTEAMSDELTRILDSIPHEDLAVQWDVCYELGILEQAQGYWRSGVMSAWWDGDPFDGLVARVVELVDAVPMSVEVGMHLCYGDAGEVHFAEPTDTQNLVRLSNAVITGSQRPLTWLHLPVPIERTDEEYYAALESLTPVNELYLGLIHREDGAAGALQRIAAAQQSIPRFGVATECGIGRAPQGTTEGILRTHADVAAAW